jgi:hypothetical protein
MHAVDGGVDHLHGRVMRANPGLRSGLAPSRFRGEADVDLQAKPARSVENDP